MQDIKEFIGLYTLFFSSVEYTIEGNNIEIYTKDPDGVIKLQIEEGYIVIKEEYNDHLNKRYTSTVPTINNMRLVFTVLRTLLEPKIRFEPLRDTIQDIEEVPDLPHKEPSMIQVGLL